MDYYSKSGRQPFFKLLLSGLLFMVFGNLLCTIVTVSTAPFMNFEFFKVIVFILTLIIFYSLMFTAGYRDGDREQKYVRLHKAEPPKESKWVLIGIILMAIMFVPSLLLLLDKLCGWYFDMTFVHRIIDGLVYPLSLMIVPENTIVLWIYSCRSSMCCATQVYRQQRISATISDIRRNSTRTI